MRNYKKMKRLLAAIGCQSQKQSKEKNMSADGADKYVKDLIWADGMLCQSATIARLRYCSDPEHLMKIINSSHTAIETVMKKHGIECRRSVEGVAFDPETMTAEENVIYSDNADLDGKVAFSSVPAFYRNGELIEEEVVVLYQYHQ